MTFVNEGDFISFRSVIALRAKGFATMTDPTYAPHHTSHHVFVKTSHKEVQLAEVGPRFEMRRTFLSSSPSFDRLFLSLL